MMREKKTVRQIEDKQRDRQKNNLKERERERGIHNEKTNRKRGTNRCINMENCTDDPK